MLCLLTYRALETAWLTLWAAYLVFWLQKPNGLSKANPVSFLLSRVIQIVQFAMMPLPVFLIVVKVTEWSGSYLILVFFLATSSVEIVVLYLYPRLIKPLTAKMRPLPEGPLKNEIWRLAEANGASESMNILSEDRHDKDLHANASFSWGLIVVGTSLINNHKEHIDEVVAVISHEIGHWKLRHLQSGLVVDTLYMVVFGAIFQLGFINNPEFLLAFGFKTESYFASVGLFVYLFLVTIDIPVRLIMRDLQRKNELAADRFSVRAGFGISAKNALIRNYKSNLNILFKSEFDNYCYGSHPTLQARLAAI